MTKEELLKIYRSKNGVNIASALYEVQKDSSKIVFTGVSGPTDDNNVLTDITGIYGTMCLNDILANHGVVELIEGDNLIYRRVAFKYIKKYLPNASEIFGDDDCIYFKISRRINNNQHNELEFLNHGSSRVARAIFNTYPEEITIMEGA